MSAFVRRHFQQFDHYSAAVLAFGLGHFVLWRFGDAGLLVAAGLVFVAACFRVYLAESARPAKRRPPGPVGPVGPAAAATRPPAERYR